MAAPAPCCEALIEAGIARVVAAAGDPNPLVGGRGFERLRAAGIEVQVGPGARQSRELNIGFFSRMERGTALGATEDSGLAGWPHRAGRRSQPMDHRGGGTRRRARLARPRRRRAHRHRHRAARTTRGWTCGWCPFPASRAVVLSTAGWRCPPAPACSTRRASSGSTPRSRPRPGGWNCRNAAPRWCPCRAPGGKVDLAADAARPGRSAEVNELHVEAGHKLNGSLLREGLVDELLVYLAPKLIGAGREMATFGPLSRSGRRPGASNSPRSKSSALTCGSWRRSRADAESFPAKMRPCSPASSPAWAASSTSRPRRQPQHGKRLTVQAPAGYLDDVHLGDSIALNGACMTVTALDAAASQLQPWTSRPKPWTRPPAWARPARSTWKRPCARTTGWAGTLVSGHVDGIGAVTHFEPVGESLELRVARARSPGAFLAYKGSITVNGVSLTVNRVSDWPTAASSAST